MIIENGVLEKIEEDDVVNGTVIIPEGIITIGSQLITRDDFIKTDWDLGELEEEKKIDEKNNRFPYNIKRIFVPKTVINIEKMAFMGLESIEKIEFEDGIMLEDIGANAFNGCSSLIGIAIPETVKLIEVDAFRGCSSIKNLTFPKDSTVIISESSFKECNNIEELHFWGKAQTCDDDIGINLIAKNVKDLEVFERTTIGNINKRLKAITIPKGVKGIGNSAFDFCKYLNEVKLQYGLEFMGDKAFAGCFKLKHIKIPESVKYMGIDVFCCSGLKSIDIPGNIARISHGAFELCLDLESVDISNGVKVIDGWAFSECHQLRKVKLPSSIEMIRKGAFFRNYSLKIINIFFKTKVDKKAFDTGCFKVRYFWGRTQSTLDEGR